MAQFLAPIINDQQEDSNGSPLSGGTIEVYLAGTSTPATTYNDKDGAAGHQNTWPIVLNTLGVNNQGAVWLTGGQAYKFVIKNSLGILQRGGPQLDNISGINDSSTSVDQWVAFAGTPTFVSATSFTVPGDQTQIFAFGTRVKTVNTSGIVYGTVARSVYTSLTTVTIVPDGGSLDSGLSSVSVGLITPVNPSLPGTLTTPPFRNRIINGAKRVDTRNSGAALTVVAAAAIAYCIDRFYVSCTGANVTVQRVAGTGYQNAVTITGAAANTGTLYGHRIESTNCYDWASQQGNVQIPISATGIASVTWNAYVANATDNFAAKTLLATGTLALTGAVETKFFSFNAGANANRGVAIEFVTGPLLAGQSITYQGAMQAEAGQLSPFEKVEIGDDQRRCKRYAQLIGVGIISNVTSGVNYGGTVTHQEMRITPSVAFVADGTSVSFAAGGLSVTPVNAYAAEFFKSANATGAGRFYSTYIATAEL
ncbi:MULTISPECIES: hypothetical protein [unclassified Variovorax]|uniref:hypothetical protein n=1 Tax=unclassified Variovorax TaxID=663243 RepID=UPI003F46F7DF